MRLRHCPHCGGRLSDHLFETREAIDERIDRFLEMDLPAEPDVAAPAHGERGEEKE